MCASRFPDGFPQRLQAAPPHAGLHASGSKSRPLPRLDRTSLMKLHAVTQTPAAAAAWPSSGAGRRFLPGGGCRIRDSRIASRPWKERPPSVPMAPGTVAPLTHQRITQVLRNGSRSSDMSPSGRRLPAGVGLPDHVHICPGRWAPRSAAPPGAPPSAPGLGASGRPELTPSAFP